MTLIRSLVALFLANAAWSGTVVSPRQVDVPAWFEPNRGQTHQAATFVARGAGYTVVLRRDGSAGYQFQTGGLLDMQLSGRHGVAQAVGEDPDPAVTHYYGGSDPARWIAGVPHYRSVRLADVYPGVDMIWQARGAALEYEFMIDAGADPGSIRLRFRGARRLVLDSEGNLVVETNAGRLYHRRPIAWQDTAGKRIEVSARFRLHDRMASLQLGPYDHGRKLWIDPVLSYATYLGGAGYDAGYAVAIDTSGSVYVTGTTGSAGFPSPNSGLLASNAAFITKLNANGSLVYTTILSSSGNTSGLGIAVDASGNAYVAGTVEGDTFPVTAGAWQIVSGGGEDAFIAKLNPTGNVVYATYVGGAGDDNATGIAVDSSGNAYVSGYTSSGNFPTTPGAAQTAYNGGPYDAFVVKLNAAGTAPIYSTLLGGSETDQALAIAVDEAGDACIVGYTDSSDLAVQAAVQASPGGEGDALVGCLNPAGTIWTMVSYLGGMGFDQANALGIDGNGNLYIAGTTFSQNFPTTPGVVQTAIAGSYDAFVAQITIGPTLGYSTFLGGSAADAATALRVGSGGDVWVAGYTASMNFPTVGAWQSSNAGGQDGFVTHLSAGATTLLASSYLGGSQQDQILGLALGPAGQVAVTGLTESTNFPVTSGATEAVAPADANAFLVEIGASTAGSYAISGQVTASTGTALSGVTVVVSGAAGASITTNSSGNFSITGLSGTGIYTVTPSLLGYTFNPPSQTFTNPAANQSASFTASPETFSIAGQVTVSGGGPLTGVTLTLSGSSSGWTTPDSTGTYSFTSLPGGGSCTITPVQNGYSFNPSSWTFNPLEANQTANFTATVSAGQSELIWQDPVSGESQMWWLGGPQGITPLTTVATSGSNPWRIVAAADLDGNGTPDLIWQNPVSGETQAWLMGGAQGNTVLAALLIVTSNPWRVVAVNDFNGDGQPDLVWQDPVSGFVQIWFLGGPQGVTVLGAANLTSSNSWQVVGSGDFNGDGQPDILWQDPVSGMLQVWFLSGPQGNIVTGAANLNIGAGWQVVSVADFNGDGHPDVIAQNQSGASQIWFLGGAQGTTLLETAAVSGPNSWRIVAPR
jgi:hypothetical protein